MHSTTEKLCSVESCDVPSYARGMCSTHYRRWLRDPSNGLQGTACMICGCERTVVGGARGMCARHYDDWRKRPENRSGDARPNRVNRIEILDTSAAIILCRRDGSTLRAVVDASDVLLVRPYHWVSALRGRTTYAYGWSENQAHIILMHRLIAGAPNDLEVDHINGDGLDNRRHNLRLATKAQNAQNRQGLCSSNTSGFRGVHFDKRSRKWRAAVRINGRDVKLGRFDDPVEAARAASNARAEMMPFSADARTGTDDAGCD